MLSGVEVSLSVPRHMALDQGDRSRERLAGESEKNGEERWESDRHQASKNLNTSGSMSTDQKKKLLWGRKKALVEQEPVVAAAGSNRWDTVQFSDSERTKKFHKLMGVKNETKEGNAPPSASGASAVTEEKQRKLQKDLEKQFNQGLERRDGRTAGLGL